MAAVAAGGGWAAGALGAGCTLAHAGDEVATEKCGGDGYATHAYPGKTREELGRVSALRNTTDSAGKMISVQAPAEIQDGSVKVPCAGTGTTVTFILPN